MIKLKQLLTEKTVRLSTMKDANFEPGQFVQLMGKKGMVKLDKKSVHKLAKIVRQLSGKKGMGWSFTMEGKLNEKFNVKDLQSSISIALDNRGITKKALKKLKKKGKDYQLYMSSYMTKGSMDKLIKNVNQSLKSKLKIKDYEKDSGGMVYIIGEGKLTESSPYKTASRNELAMYISQLSTTIKNTKDRKMLNMLKKDKKEVEKELKSRKTNEGKLTEAVYQLPKGFKGSDVDELDAELYRAGLRGAIPDFNKGTITWHDKPGRVGGLSRIKKILKKHKAKKIKEGKLNEGSKTITLPNGIKVKIEFDGLTFIGGTKPVFLDRTEMMTFFKATARYLK